MRDDKDLRYKLAHELIAQLKAAGVDLSDVGNTNTIHLKIAEALYAGMDIGKKGVFNFEGGLTAKTRFDK